MRYITKSLWLLFFSVIICCIIYPAAVWVIGRVCFPFQADGSMVNGPDGKPVGSLLIAQPFTKPEYFQPRPSACSYDASASSSSAIAATNYALRARIAQQIGPIVTYKSGPKTGQLVAPDIETWFQKDKFAGSPGIVAQWADNHNGMAQGWVKSTPAITEAIADWATAHPALVKQFVAANPTIPSPQPNDLAVFFFEQFSKQYPGKFPSVTATTGTGGNITSTSIVPVTTGGDIQSNFFDMWLQDHPDAQINDVPGDMVTSSGSGLDPHITLQNAEFQADGVAAKWAADTKRDPKTVRGEIETLLQDNAAAPFGGLAGEKMVNVLQINLALRKQYGAPQ
ncbi:MAG: potassium-transporting ATPase subunit C [Chthoniobacteraceae bacterium]|jgi:K+-transporting ATPase ATPase C chain